MEHESQFAKSSQSSIGSQSNIHTSVIIQHLSENVFNRCNYTVAVNVTESDEALETVIDNTDPLVFVSPSNNKENKQPRLSNRLPIPSISSKKISIQVPKNSIRCTADSLKLKNAFASTCEEPMFINNNDKAIQTEEMPKQKQDLDDQQLDEQELDSYLKNANSYFAQKQYEKLNEFLYRFKNRYKNINERIQYKWNALMAICKTQKKQYSDAIKFYHQCLDLYDTYDLQTPATQHAKLLNSLGIVYLELGNCKMSVLALQNALVLFREQRQQRLFSETMNNMGVVYLKSGMIEEALQLLKECYQLKVAVFCMDSAAVISTIYNISECYILLEQYNSAETLLKDVYNLLVRNRMVDHLPEVYRRMGTLEHMRGNRNKAKIYFDSVKYQWPNDLDYAHMQHQVALLEMNKGGDRNKARRCLEEAIKVYKIYTDSNNDLIKKAEENLELLSRIRL